MVDTENVLFRKNIMHYFVQRHRGRQIIPKRLFNDHPRPLRRTGKLQLFENYAKQDWWNGKVVNGMFCIPEFLADVGKRLRVLIVPIDVTKLVEEDRKTNRVNASVSFDAVFCPGLELVQIPSRLGNANDWAGQLSTLGQLL